MDDLRKLVWFILVTAFVAATIVTLTGCGKEEKHKVEVCTPVGFDKPASDCVMKTEYVNGIYLAACCKLAEEK